MDTYPNGGSPRDLTWDALLTVAKRLSDRYPDSGLEVRGVRRRSLGNWSVEEGLWVGDYWTDVFEPVRSRRMLSRRWAHVQPVGDAASKIGTFMRTWTDLAER